MRSNNILVTIVVPCYKQAEFLSEAIESVMAQTYLNWECIIVNDGSPDNTEEVALTLCKEDNRVKYLWKENGGLASARNFGITHSIGELILPLDADDKIEKDYIKLAVAEMDKNPEIKVVYCNANFFGEINGSWNLQDFSLTKLAYGNMIFCTALFSKESWKKVGGYDENMIYGWEDWEFWISILKDGGEVVRLSYEGFFYRARHNSMARSLDKEKSNYLENYLCKKHLDFFNFYLGNQIFLYRELLRYKGTLEYLNNKKLIRIYKSVKKAFKIGKSNISK